MNAARCPHCGVRHNFRDESFATVARCLGCGQSFYLPPPVYVHASAPAARPPSNSLGIASMVIGLVTLPMIFFVCFPPLAVVALLLSCVGFLVGLVGLAGCLGRRGYGIGYPVAGLAANGVAGLVMALVLAGVSGGALGK